MLLFDIQFYSLHIPYILMCMYIYIHTYDRKCMYIKKYIYIQLHIYITYPIPIQTDGSLLSPKVPVVPEHCATACLSWGHRYVGYVVNGIQPSDLCNWGYPIYLILN